MKKQRLIKLPNMDIQLDLNHEYTAYVSQSVRNSFYKLTKGTSQKYRNQDKLYFIDLIVEQLNEYHDKTELQIMAEICKEHQREFGVDDYIEAVDYEEPWEVDAWIDENYDNLDIAQIFRGIGRNKLWQGGRLTDLEHENLFEIIRTVVDC